VIVDPRQESERRHLLGSEAGELDLWSGEDTKGWNRLSITRRSGPPALTPEDLLLPSGVGNLRMLVSCAGMSLLATVLYVWVPLMLVNFFLAITGVVMVAALGGAFLAFTLGLFLWGTIETQRDRELASHL
jgi:hypothetical protein